MHDLLATRVLASLCLGLLPAAAAAQNLVRNPSFEQKTSCPNTSG